MSRDLIISRTRDLMGSDFDYSLFETAYDAVVRTRDFDVSVSVRNDPGLAREVQRMVSSISHEIVREMRRLR